MTSPQSPPQDSEINEILYQHCEDLTDVQHIKLKTALKQALYTALVEQQTILPLTCGHSSDECQCERHYVIPLSVLSSVLGKE